VIFSVGNLNIYVHEETSWLVGSHFLPFWNVFESGSISPNNHVAGWHNHLNTISEKAHSNGFEIVNKKKIGLTGRSLRKTARLMSCSRGSIKSNYSSTNVFTEITTNNQSGGIYNSYSTDGQGFMAVVNKSCIPVMPSTRTAINPRHCAITMT